MVEWYHSRGSAVNCREPRNANRERVGHPPKAEGKTAQQGAAAGGAVGTAMEAGQRAIDKKNQKPRDQHD